MTRLFDDAQPAIRKILDGRVCSDCEEYAPIEKMTDTPAGNVICPKCAKRRATLAASRDQMTMFGQRSLLDADTLSA